MTLEWLDLELAVCRLPPTADIPAWALAAPLLSATRTDRELSLVVPVGSLPPPSVAVPDLSIESPWRALRIAGTLPFTLVGVVASLTRPLADAGIPIFVLSTFDTDYILIASANARAAARALTEAGHEITDAPPH